MPFTLEQSIVTEADIDAGASPTVTFPVGATAGNLIVVALGHRRSDASSTPVISGTSGLTREFVYTDNTNGNKGVALFWKVAAGGETTFTSTESQQWRYIAAAEFALPSGASGVSWHNHATAVENAGATTLTVSVPDPATTDSLAWVSTFGRDATLPTYDSGFATGAATPSPEDDFAVSWRDDATGVTGNDVTATYSGSTISIGATGVWTVDGTALATPTNWTLTKTDNTAEIVGSWTAVSGATSYEYEVEEWDGSNWQLAITGSVDDPTTTFTLTSGDGIKFSTLYRSRVRAV